MSDITIRLDAQQVQSLFQLIKVPTDMDELELIASTEHGHVTATLEQPDRTITAYLEAEEDE